MVTTSLADAALENLLALAREAAKRSYSPYSGFRVGAALRLTNGEIVLSSTPAPPAAAKLIAVLDKYSSRK